MNGRDSYWLEPQVDPRPNRTSRRTGESFMSYRVFTRFANAVLIGVLYGVSMATAQTPAPRDLPARTIPVPDTVSPQMQKLIAAPLNPAWNVIPKTADEWKAQVNASAAAALQTLPALRQELHVKVEPLTVDGVMAYMVTPENIPAENRNRLLVHVHGGCYVFSPGEAGTREAIFMAGFGRFKIFSVDYRMPPDHPYPAALDDAMTVWKAAVKMANHRNMAIFGSSAGGALTLSMTLTNDAVIKRKPFALMI